MTHTRRDHACPLPSGGRHCGGTARVWPGPAQCPPTAHRHSHALETADDSQTSHRTPQASRGRGRRLRAAHQGADGGDPRPPCPGHPDGLERTPWNSAELWVSHRSGDGQSSLPEEAGTHRGLGTRVMRGAAALAVDGTGAADVSQHHPDPLAGMGQASNGAADLVHDGHEVCGRDCRQARSRPATRPPALGRPTAVSDRP
jgi:hypothetical protein